MRRARKKGRQGGKKKLPPGKADHIELRHIWRAHSSERLRLRNVGENHYWLIDACTDAGGTDDTERWDKAGESGRKLRPLRAQMVEALLLPRC